MCVHVLAYYGTMGRYVAGVKGVFTKLVSSLELAVCTVICIVLLCPHNLLGRWMFLNSVESQGEMSIIALALLTLNSCR